MRPHSRTEPCLLPYGLGACTWAQFESECKVCSMPFDVGPPEDRRSGGYNDRLSEGEDEDEDEEENLDFPLRRENGPCPVDTGVCVNRLLARMQF